MLNDVHAWTRNYNVNCIHNLQFDSFPIKVKRMLIESVESLRKVAAEFAVGIKAPKCVALYGDLGAGKTEFARAVIQSLRGAGTIVPSPTFTLVQEYPGVGGNISHFDLYRIKDERELEEIGFFDALAKNITLIEWPEVAKKFLPVDTIHVRIVVKDGGRGLLWQ